MLNYIINEPIIPIDKNDNVLSLLFKLNGITVSSIDFFNPSANSLLDSKLLDFIDLAAECLISHIEHSDKIWILVDSDCDGYTSAAILINYLKKAYPDIGSNIITNIHLNKEHGILDSNIPKIIESNVKLVIAPDSSSSELSVHKRLKDNGIDVLVLDHHEAVEFSTNAIIINNHTCEYPNKELSGAGIVYKFCKYLDSKLNINYADNFKDLAAIGIIGDMMELKNLETRYIVNSGLSNILNKFLQELIRYLRGLMSKFNRITPHNISFYIVPLINAITRVGTSTEKLKVFDALCESTELNYQEVILILSDARDTLTKLVTKYYKMISKIIDDNNLLKNKVLVVRLDRDALPEKTLTGLIANKLISEYKRPVLLLTNHANNWAGSGRGFPVRELLDFKKFVTESNFALLAEGHANAFGVEFEPNAIDNFLNYSNNKLSNCNFDSCELIDFCWNYDDYLLSDNVNLIANLSDYWCNGFSEPKILILNVPINNLKLLSPDKHPTIKFSANNVEYIKFGSSVAEYLLLTNVKTVSVTATCTLNNFRGKTTNLLIINSLSID